MRAPRTVLLVILLILSLSVQSFAFARMNCPGMSGAVTVTMTMAMPASDMPGMDEMPPMSDAMQASTLPHDVSQDHHGQGHLCPACGLTCAVSLFVASNSVVVPEDTQATQHPPVSLIGTALFQTDGIDRPPRRMFSI